MKIPYGYVLVGERIAIHEERTDVVCSIFEYYLAGASLGKIVAMLFAKSIASPTGNAKWTRAAVDKLLANKKYIPIVGVDVYMDAQFERDHRWLTDVTEFKYYVGSSVHKLYLSIILELCDRRTVSFVLRDANDSALVHETLDQALASNPDAHPLFHSDRGFQYTTRVFHDKLAAAGMTQSISQVGKCILWRASGASSSGSGTMAGNSPAGSY